MNARQDRPDAILDFWFREITPKQWWLRSDDFDRQIQSRFGTLQSAAGRCELYGWRETGTGRLAEIIVLDQFSRNIFRGHPWAFACDALALALAQSALAVGADHELDPVARMFFYMPYMHSESPMIHAVAVSLFSQPGMAENLAFELRHKQVIDRFGRYPHRNEILGRTSTAEEMAFLKLPGSSF